MKTQIVKVSILAIVMLLFLIPVNAQRGNCRIVDSIPGITKEQKIKIAAIREANRIEMNELRDKKQKAASWDEKDKVEHQMIEQRAKNRNEIKAVLTPEQQKYFDENYYKPSGKGNKHYGNKHHKR